MAVKTVGPGIDNATGKSDSQESSQESAYSGSSSHRQNKMTKFVKVTVTTKEEKHDLDVLAAKFWYSANLSFNAANLQTWKNLCHGLRHGYDPPSEHMLQGPLLDKIYDNLRENMKSNLDGKCGTLIQDGWSDIHNSPTLSHTVVCNADAYLINTIKCEAEKKTSEYCAEKFEEAMKQVEEMGLKIVAGSTDNCSTMVKMRDILCHKYPNMLFYGCSPHMLNLLCEDVTPKQVVAKINEVIHNYLVKK